ncbi:MAG: 50S ribosomal protein L11 [Planctomycetia bacterium]|nr:50S ribosomal protein L11 [Planctomycetia bacterium]
MAKKIVAQVKVQITGGQATPAPPVGTALGPHGINLGKFVQEFNAKTKDISGTIVPVIVTIFNDRSFEFILKSPPASVLLKKIAGVAKGAQRPNSEKVGIVTKEQVVNIAKEKLVDLNTSDLAAACRMIEGTARSMGITIAD